MRIWSDIKRPKIGREAFGLASRATLNLETPAGEMSTRIGRIGHSDACGDPRKAQRRGAGQEGGQIRGNDLTSATVCSHNRFSEMKHRSRARGLKWNLSESIEAWLAETLRLPTVRGETTELQPSISPGKHSVDTVS